MQTAQSGGARSAGQPFFGQTGGVTPDSSSGGQPGESGEAFTAKGGGAAQPSSLPPPTQTLKMQQAAARNRAQKPSGKTNDAKPVFKVQALSLMLAPGQSMHTCQSSRAVSGAAAGVATAFAERCLLPTHASSA